MYVDEEIEQLALFIIILGGAFLLLPPVTRRRWWTKPWISKRNNKGNLVLVHDELANEDPKHFRNFLRMDKDTFEYLLKLIQPAIEKENTIMRECISARDRLTVTLRYLATGESYKSLMFSFRIGHSTISKFVPEVCTAIYNGLKAEYLKTPVTPAEWLSIAEEFQVKWNLPNVLGAIDGKHIMLQAPRSEGSTYFNYKGTHSIVLLALVDANYKFRYIDVGCNGRVSDGGVFARSTLSHSIKTNKLNFPAEQPLPGRTKPLPFVIVADAAFPLSYNILKPFPFRNMSEHQRIFNYRLSRARRVVENAFGILANRFRILLNTINLKPDKVETITLTCLALHNLLITKNISNYGIYNDNDIDRRYILRYGLSQQIGNRSTKDSLNNRLEFMEYVNGVGAVAWQNSLL
ncbi:hypothetical protein RI129_010577 [Pyrocoelia pectoralis]|uniref:DDE Tnp4 domain-containing protein n=1 Tax=Pyrocoelia pectoralis TaxID=417401 RepID=A0AAN7V790_9COLE